MYLCVFSILDLIYFIYPTYPSGGQLVIVDASEITVGDTSETLASQTISVSVERRRLGISKESVQNMPWCVLLLKLKKVSKTCRGATITFTEPSKTALFPDVA